jgi:3-hydroxyacyl-[acyl-carrier-protein] dehydratase
MGLLDIERLIPHRPPFLFVDRVVEHSKTTIRTAKQFHPDESFFSGHYPGDPLVPGVILCEAVFQSGAILVARMVGGVESGTPVLTRIKNVKFKHIVRPGDQLDIQVELVERLKDAFFLKGSALVKDTRVVQLEFACARLKA